MAATKIARQPIVPRDVPRALMPLPFPFQHASQHLAPLFGLPDLIGILILIEIEKFLVSLQGGLRLVQLIVTNCADKPDARPRLFHFCNLVERAQRRRIIPSQKERGAEIFSVRQVPAIELQRDAQLFFRRNKLASLKEDASQAAVELGVVWGESERLMKRRDRIIPFFLRDLDVCSKL